jgi:hypothetical protein
MENLHVVEGKPARSRTRFVNDYARKRNRKEALANYNKNNREWMDILL